MSLYVPVKDVKSDDNDMPSKMICKRKQDTQHNNLKNKKFQNKSQIKI
jgi:hypothetical protein